MLKKTTQDETHKYRYELEVWVSPEDFEDAVQKTYLKQKAKIMIPGFRPGKAPRKMIETQYGEGIFWEDAVNSIYQKTVEDAVHEAGLSLVTPPEVDVSDISKENGVTFKVVCIIKPEVTVGDCNGIKVTKTVHPVTEEMIEHEIGHVLEKNSRKVDVDDRPAQNGDTVEIDFEGFKDGVAFEGGKAEKYELTLGSGQFIPGFEDQVVGHSVGDEFDINVTFPEDYQAKELAGAPVVFKIKLHSISYTELPELDDDFVKDTSDFETVEEFRADIKKHLEEHADEHAESDVEGAIMDEVINRLEGDIPDVMYENQVSEMIDELSHRLEHQGLTLEMYMQYMGNMTMDSLRKLYREQAEKQVKLRLALEQYAKDKNIEVSEEEIEAEYDKLAGNYGMKSDELKKLINADALKEDLAVGKAVDAIKAAAVVETVTAPAEEEHEHHEHGADEE